ncbi:MAG: hypothetical protein AAB767_05305 [Patescibacteria group bacterium]
MHFSSENLNGAEQPDNSAEKAIIDFRQEMRTLKTQEEQAAVLKEKDASVNSEWHFEKINPDELTLEDRDMWEAVKSNLSGGPADILRSIFQDYCRRAEASGNQSRMAFSAFVANKLTVIIGRQQLRELSGED